MANKTVLSRAEEELLAELEQPDTDDKKRVKEMTALDRAAEGGHGEIVAYLLAHNPALIENVTRCGNTALHLAARAGHDRIVQQLLSIKPELANARPHCVA